MFRNPTTFFVSYTCRKEVACDKNAPCKSAFTVVRAPVCTNPVGVTVANVSTEPEKGEGVLSRLVGKKTNSRGKRPRKVCSVLLSQY